jgi:hypothetical protein
MPTTSNFGWTTPADTDLVKDGAAAIRTLGNGVDTSLVDLKGGTTGQILSKASNADMDFVFITPNVGDITEVQAGTGISIASGTGPIPVVTNTVATAFDAAGDLVYGTGADTFTKLSLGTAGKVLTVNSGATAPEWAAPAAPTFVGASGFRNSSFTVADSTDTYVAFPDTDEYDTNAIHDPASNNTRFTIPTGKTGYWLLQFSPMTTGHTSAFSHRSLVRVNGSTKIYRHSMLIPANSGEYDIYFSKVVKLTAGDYIEFAVWQNSGGTRTYYCAVNAGEKQGMATVSYLGA